MDAALLDTDTVNEVLKRRNANVVQHAATYLAVHPQFSISAITRYELLRGLKEKQALKQLANFETFCQHSSLVVPTLAIMDRAADLWVDARRGGHPGRDADLLIAATALELQQVLVTGNTRHFSWISGLRIEDWRQP